MNVIFYLTGFFFFFWEIRNILFLVNLWQIKEYRFDRLFSHLKETSQGKDILFSALPIVKLIAILGFGFVIFNNFLLLPYQLFIFFIFCLQFLKIIKEIWEHTLKIPVLTFKALFITTSTLFIVSLLFFLPLIDKFAWILIIDKLVFLIIAFAVFFLSFPTNFYRGFQEERAIKKIRKHKNLLVIGVTGSYGKSSTKEYIAQILEKKFKVLKTKGTNNTLIGVTNTIISGLKDDTEIFVVEMGAYKKGEINEICEIVKPKIGIITGINSQHLSLFGSLQNTMDAKYELINSLPSGGLAIFNGSNINSSKLYSKTKKKKIIYSSFDNKADIYSSDIQIEKSCVAFDVHAEGIDMALKANLIGKQNVENILPAAYIARYLGMNITEIKKAVSKLKPLPKTMTKIKFSNGATLIDDAFNANPDAVLAVLDYMKIYNGKKILVMQPMIELGKDAKKEHYRVALEISKICDYLVLTNKNFYSSVSMGIKDGKGKCAVKIFSPGEIVDFVKSNLTPASIAVFEGKETLKALSKLQSL
ncbi:MAG: UDP-N-acetylmuramoyl-tripeptide--D-alanyl-D-alanine ligase [Candidatus Levyibacteriota bacterium]